mgnify:CR=1 FL=1
MLESSILKWACDLKCLSAVVMVMAKYSFHHKFDIYDRDSRAKRDVSVR